MTNFKLGPNQLALVEALESGEYKQGFGYLKIVQKDETFSHCCLGVASELAIAAQGDDKKIVYWGSIYDVDASTDAPIKLHQDDKSYGYDISLPVSLVWKDFLDLHGQGGRMIFNSDCFNSDDQEIINRYYGVFGAQKFMSDVCGLSVDDRTHLSNIDELVELNDNGEYSFKDIARLMRRFPRVFFKSER